MRKFFINIGFLFAATLLTTFLWYAGLEKGYAHLLVFSTNSVLNVSGRDSHITLEKEDGVDTFRAHTVIDGQRANYPQKLQTLLLPAVMLIAWQLFTSFFRSRKQILHSASTTIGIFLALQIIFLLLLTAYYSSSVAKYVYDVMLDSFYIIALGIIILDYIRYPLRLREGLIFRSKK